MKMLDKLYEWYGKRNVLVVFAVLLLLVVMIVFKGGIEDVANEAIDTTPLVETATPLELSNTQVLQLIGTVRSLDAASIESEIAGRVTRVNVSLGETVSAGSVIAELENASQYASLLQAEGVYEAAQAAAAQSDSSLETAQTALTSAESSAVSTFRQAYTAVSAALYGDIDVFYRNPQSISPSLQIGTEGNGSYLRSERKALQDIMENWQEASTNISSDDDLPVALQLAQENTSRVIGMIDVFISLTSDSDDDAQIDGVAVRTYTATLIAQRSNLNNTLNSLSSAAANLETAKSALTQAEIASTQGTDFSAANAQVKQALGGLRAAQANYQKTLLRTPISGSVQSLSVQRGDFVNTFDVAAKIVGDGGLEITTFVGENEQDLLSIGQTVKLENNSNGVITNIAPAVDAQTKKTELRIATESETIRSGDTVEVFIEQPQDTPEVVVPLAAIKLTAGEAAVFAVLENTLVAIPVILGDIRGSNVVIEEGISNDDVIVSDVRGLSSGQQVDVK